MSVRMLPSALVVGALSVVSAPAGLAQAPIPEEARTAMAPLAWLAGEWAGEATLAERGGTRVLHQTEEVRQALEGSLLVVEGTGREPAHEGAVAFRAFAVLSAGDEPGQYRVAAWRAGRFGDARAEVAEDGTLTWGFLTPDGGEVRYVTRQPEPGVWHETGAFRATGDDAWRPFLEMTLRREPSGSGR